MVSSRRARVMKAEYPPSRSRPATPPPTMSSVIIVRRRLRKTLRNASSKNLLMAGSFKIRPHRRRPVVGGPGMCVADDAAVGEADNARCVLEQALVVRREDKGEAEAAVQVAHEVDELGGIVCVEIGSGLVCKDQGGAMDDGTRNGYALAFSAGEQVGPMVGAGGQADVIECLCNALAALNRADALNKEWVFHVLAGSEDGDEVEGLKNEAYLFPPQNGGLRGVEPRGVGTGDEDAAAGGPVDAANQVQQSGFAAAAGAGDGKKFAGIDAETDVIEGRYRAVVERNLPRDLLNAYEWIGWGHRAVLPFQSGLLLWSGR